MRRCWLLCFHPIPIAFSQKGFLLFWAASVPFSQLCTQHPSLPLLGLLADAAYVFSHLLNAQQCLWEQSSFQTSLPVQSGSLAGQLAWGGAGHWTRLLRGSQGLGLVPQVGTCLLTSPPLWLGLEWQEGTRSGWSVRRKGSEWGAAIGQNRACVLSALSASTNNGNSIRNPGTLAATFSNFPQDLQRGHYYPGAKLPTKEHRS